MQASASCGALLLPWLGAGESAPAAAATAVATGGPTSESAEAPGETPRVFEKDEVRGDGCPLLSAAEVAELAGIEVGVISTSPAMDCFYEWANGRVMMMGVKVHRSEEHTSELQSLMRSSYAVF